MAEPAKKLEPPARDAVQLVDPESGQVFDVAADKADATMRAWGMKRATPEQIEAYDHQKRIQAEHGSLGERVKTAGEAAARTVLNVPAGVESLVGKALGAPSTMPGLLERETPSLVSQAARERAEANPKTTLGAQIGVGALGAVAGVGAGGLAGLALESGLAGVAAEQEASFVEDRDFTAQGALQAAGLNFLLGGAGYGAGKLAQRLARLGEAATPVEAQLHNLLPAAERKALPSGFKRLKAGEEVLEAEFADVADDVAARAAGAGEGAAASGARAGRKPGGFAGAMSDIGERIPQPVRDIYDLADDLGVVPSFVRAPVQAARRVKRGLGMVDKAASLVDRARRGAAQRGSVVIGPGRKFEMPDLAEAEPGILRRHAKGAIEYGDDDVGQALRGFVEGFDDVDSLYEMSKADLKRRMFDDVETAWIDKFDDDLPREIKKQAKERIAKVVDSLDLKAADAEASKVVEGNRAAWSKAVKPHLQRAVQLIDEAGGTTRLLAREFENGSVRSQILDALRQAGVVKRGPVEFDRAANQYVSRYEVVRKGEAGYASAGEHLRGLLTSPLGITTVGGGAALAAAPLAARAMRADEGGAEGAASPAGVDATGGPGQPPGGALGAAPAADPREARTVEALNNVATGTSQAIGKAADAVFSRALGKEPKPTREQKQAIARATDSGQTLAMARFVGPKADDPVEAFERKRDALSAMTDDPNALLDRMGQNWGDLPERHPSVYQAMVMQAARVVSYLKDRMPSPTGKSLLEPDGFPPATDEIEAWAGHWQGATAPMTVLADAALDAAAPEALDAVKANWAPLYERFQQNAVERLQRLRASDEPLPPSEVEYLDRILGLGGALDPMLGDEMGQLVAQANQRAGAPPSAQPPPKTNAFQTEAPERIAPKSLESLRE